MSSFNFLKKTLFDISKTEASFSKRGFTSDSPRRQAYLESIGETFISGYKLALQFSQMSELESQLNLTPLEMRGFAFEGAAMAHSLLDRVTFNKNKRFNAFVRGPANKHKYMAYVGVGWAMARLPWGVKNHLNSLDPLLRWLSMDGYGFHQGYFHCKKTITQQIQPKNFNGYMLRGFDQGLGRSLWFVKGGDAEHIVSCIQNFDESRHGDMWAGIGLASSYAGGVEENTLKYLYQQAKKHSGQLAQGAVFTAKARTLADNMAEHTVLACQVYLQLSPENAAMIADQAQISLPPDQHNLPAFEIWRQRIQSLTTTSIIKVEVA